MAGMQIEPAWLEEGKDTATCTLCLMVLEQPTSGCPDAHARCTLTPTPYTFNLTPYTLNLTPYALNPPPYTLRRLLDGISNSQNSPNQGLRIRDPRANPLLDGPNQGLRIRDSSDRT